MTGKKNMVFGFFYFLFTLGLGIYLAKMMEAGGSAWLTGAKRETLRAAHAHGNLESFLNITIGYLLCRLKLEGWAAKGRFRNPHHRRHFPFRDALPRGVRREVRVFASAHRRVIPHLDDASYGDRHTKIADDRLTSGVFSMKRPRGNILSMIL